MEVYFDNGATTKTTKSVMAVVSDIMENIYGNPSSLHRKGVEAERIMKNAREIIVKKLNVTDGEIIFTSGGTESNNLAITGSCMRMREKCEIITTKVEHKCVLTCFENLEKAGFKTHYAGVDENGCVNEDELLSLVNSKTGLVSVMAVNNEVGSINKIEELYRKIKKINPGCIFHTDAVQALGKIPLPKNCADLITVSGHKLKAPKGIGALYVKKGIKLSPIIFGGGQENGLRSGTENVPAIGGFAMALEENTDSMAYVGEIKDKIVKRVTSEIEDVYINSPADGSPFILNISVLGLRSEILLHSLEQHNIYVSSGSACSSNKPSPSHVLTAMGYNPARVDSSIRISLSDENTLEQADYFVDKLKEICKVNEKIRKMRRK